MKLFLDAHCYITYAMDFWFIPSEPVCLASCHILISKQDSMIRAPRSNRFVTRKRSCDENHTVRFRQSAENRSRARDTQPTRGVSDKLARGCKCWHPLAPGRRYGKKSSLWVYVSLPISHTTNINPFENKVREICFCKEVCSFVQVCKLCLIMFPLVYVCGYTTNVDKID